MLRSIRHLQSMRPAIFLAMAGVWCASMLLAMAMAASAELHEHAHHDADEEEHECFVTHLMAGTFGDGAPVPQIDLRPELVQPDLASRTSNSGAVPPLYLENGVLEHAPPQRG